MLLGSKVSLLKAGTNPLLHHPLYLAQYQVQSKYFKNDSELMMGLKQIYLSLHLQNWIETLGIKEIL